MESNSEWYKVYSAVRLWVIRSMVKRETAQIIS